MSRASSRYRGSASSSLPTPSAVKLGSQVGHHALLLHHCCSITLPRRAASRCRAVAADAPSPTLSPTHPVPRGLLTLCRAYMRRAGVKESDQGYPTVAGVPVDLESVSGVESVWLSGVESVWCTGAMRPTPLRRRLPLAPLASPLPAPPPCLPLPEMVHAVTEEN